ncbi:MAG: YjbH domain-containing protein [Sterolibacterium sp.]|jgi:hypothetical protein
MKNRVLRKHVIVAGLLGLASSAFPAEQMLSPNGYSGLGMIPSAQVLPLGTAVVAVDPTIPGARNTSGYNDQIGFGLYDNLELVGRLATNDLKCDMFRARACPPDTIRDVSASLKWSLPIPWLRRNNAAVAAGLTDMGGAASLFKSYYIVGTKSFDHIDVSLGKAKGVGGLAALNGTFAALAWKPREWSKLSLQRIGTDSWASAAVSAPISDTGLEAWLTFNHRIGDSPITDRSWFGWGFSVPLDRSERVRSTSTTSGVAAAPQNRAVPAIKPDELPDAFVRNGFYNPRIGRRPNGGLVFELESASYAWNILDGVGVALGLIAGAYGNDVQLQEFELMMTTRGIRQVLVSGEASCVKMWLAEGNPCPQLTIQSLNQRKRSPEPDGDIAWLDASPWSFRPEFIVSPTLVSLIGNERGAFEIDLGANINTVLPLWTGAYWDINNIRPLGVNTRVFERNGFFHDIRLQPVSSRRLFHQLLNYRDINTQARLSIGTAYLRSFVNTFNYWHGRQLETSSQSDNGHHKLGLTFGSFQTDGLQFNNKRTYNLVNYRLIPDDKQRTSTEITYGKFWGGDKGYNIGQRFWHGDTAVNIYIRQTRRYEQRPLGDVLIGPVVSFAGIEFSIPLTPRRDKGLQHLLVRGTSQWTYKVETRVFDDSNSITPGYGEVPNVGDSLVQTFNRDRNSTQYLESNMGRIKNAFFTLSED